MTRAIEAPHILRLNPFPLRGIRSETVLPAADEIVAEASETYRQFIRVGDEPVAFVDKLTDADAEPNMTISKHLDANHKIDAFLEYKNVEELIEAGYYIGPCVVGLVCQVDGKMTTQPKIRLAIFQQNSRNYS